MTDDLLFRGATIDDVAFLVTASRSAERLPIGDGSGMYERVYGLTREECDRFYMETLAQETKDNQLTYRTFNVLTRGVRSISQVRTIWTRQSSSSAWHAPTPSAGPIAIPAS